MGSRQEKMACSQLDSAQSTRYLNTKLLSATLLSVILLSATFLEIPAWFC